MIDSQKVHFDVVPWVLRTPRWVLPRSEGQDGKEGNSLHRVAAMVGVFKKPLLQIQFAIVVGNDCWFVLNAWRR